MSAKDKWVRRFSVDETARHKNGFTIYKITSVLFPIESPEAVTVVCVWKRYSDVQRLHRSMAALHAGLHLRGSCPQPLPKFSYFKRFQKEVIEERAKAIKKVLEFVAEHQLLFTSADFVNFLQTGYPEPAEPVRVGGGVIDSIRAALRLPRDPPAPPTYHDHDDDNDDDHHDDHHHHDDGRSTERTQSRNQPESTRDETDFASIPQIPIYEPATVERPQITISNADSFESIPSIESLNDDLYEELSKQKVKHKSAVKSQDLINFDLPSSSRFSLDSVSVSSTAYSRSDSVSVSRSVLSLSNAECKTRTEDSYVFEAGYMLNLAARCEDAQDYARAFDYYKSGIEKMLIGVQTDTDPQRRALIKEKTNKYLSYAEEIYKNHLCNVDESPLSPERSSAPARAGAGGVPARMLRRGAGELAQYGVLAARGRLLLVLQRRTQACLAMKVIQKIPNNLTEFDEYFHQRTNETKQPILPTNIPYMVPLHAYIETNNLIFLILGYAPGEKLLDYIKNYVKSIPNTPAREVNLENVFSEPMKRDKSNDTIKFIDDDNDINDNDETGDMDVNELVRNSQKLLLNVDRVLKETPKIDEGGEDGEVKEAVEVEVKSEVKEVRSGSESPSNFRRSPGARRALPSAAVRRWAAEVLTALESLHNAGVVCRDLNTSNILLSDGGQITLTYMVGYELGVSLSRLSSRISSGPAAALHWAPELYAVCVEEDSKVCDYWSFGVIMYELLCGVPLSYYHKSVFTSHTLLLLPAGLTLEEESLLTQLLTFDPTERLGYKNGIEEIKQHPYFKHIDWQYVYDSWIVPG